MHFPTEIQALIIQAAIETIPFRDLLRARLVNSFFALKIDSLLHLSPHLETEGFLFNTGKESDPCVKSPIWEHAPASLKRRYLDYRAEKWRERPCRFSLTLKTLLEMAQEGLPMAAEKQTVLRDNFIDVWPLGHKCCAWHALGPLTDLNDRYCRSGKIDLDAVLACSAALRGDCDELQGILDRVPRRKDWENKFDYEFAGRCHLDLFNHSSEFGQLRFYEVAGQVGNAEIMKTLTSNEHYMTRVHLITYRKKFPTVTARAGNWVALKTLIHHFRHHPRTVSPSVGYGSLAWRFRTAIHGAVTGGKFHILESLSLELEDEVDMVEFNFEILMQAIRFGDIGAVQYALQKENIDINGRHIDNYDDSPLFSAFFETSSTLKLSIIRLLLEHGADVHECRLQTGKTLMEYALAKGCGEVVELIVDHEKKLPGSHSNFPYKTRRRKMLQAAVRYRSVSLIEVLQGHHGDMFYSRKGKTFTVRRKGLGMGGSERIINEIEENGDVKYLVTVCQNR